MTDEQKDIQQTITTLAFLDERDALYEVCNDALNLMAYVDDYRKAVGEHGERHPATTIAQGKMFSAVHTVQKKKLRKRILDIQERLREQERKLGKTLGKDKKDKHAKDNRSRPPRRG